MTITLDSYEVSYDRKTLSDVRIIYYELEYPGKELFQCEVVVFEDDWEYDSDKNPREDELLLSNAVLILNEIFKSYVFLYFNGSRYQSLGVDAISFQSHIGDLSKESAKVLSEHYFEQPFNVKTTNV